ncbi:MAG TPA: prephenate dehydrogenase/arogenate dehydrogenase family protein [Nitrososphaeraceae archaeon]|nr:prephenate dehydrogenase/arogenate dehydrogenase family protein [Nitrososphaeraceae archaeon]
MIKEIAIIGAGGKMGSWFLKYFSNRKEARLLLYDSNISSIKPSIKATVCNNLGDCVANADLVMVCVPVRNTPKIIKECASKMKSGAILAEISSVKHQVFTKLKKLPNDIKPLCIHPMFGEGATNVKKMKILLIPVNNKEDEVRILNNVFVGAIIIVIPNANIHDKMIAVVLGLTYFTNIAFASIICKENISKLKEAAGTTFRIQSLLSESILIDEPDLFIALLTANPAVRRYIQNYLKELNNFEKMIFQNNHIKLEARLVRIKSLIQKQQNLQISYRQMYSLIEGLDKEDSKNQDNQDKSSPRKLSS